MFGKQKGADATAAQTEQALQFQLLRIDSQIKTEAELINFRVQWLLTTQAFVFAGYFLKLPAGSRLAEILPRALLLIGMASSVFITGAIVVAFFVTWDRRKLRQRIEAAMTTLDYAYLASPKPNGVPNFIGAIPPIAISVLIFLSWVLIWLAL